MKQKNNLFKIILLLILTAGGVSAFNWSDGSTNEYLPPDSEIASGQHVKARHMQSYKNALEDLHERAWRKTGSYSFYNGGNVGIGTATPSAKLDVEGGAIEPAKGNGLDWTDNPYGGSGDDAWIKYIQDGSGEDTELQIGIANDGADNIAFYQSGSERMTIYNGKVGINKTNPSRTLDVNGDINFTGTLYQNDSVYAGVTSLDDLSDAQHDTHNNLFLGQAGFSGGTYYNDYNTAVGVEAFDNPNTDNAYSQAGNDNTAIGYNSLTNNTTGHSNTTVGFKSLYSNTNGWENTAIGFKSLYSNTSGYDNTAIGYNSLTNNISGSNNTSLGYYALYANEDGIQNTAVGNNALSTNQGSYNTAIGYNALNSTTSGDQNIAIGVNALGNNTSGSSNVASGVFALRRNTTGNRNIASGQESLFNNQTGNYNIGIGYFALYDNYDGRNNIAIGDHALENNTTDGGYDSGDDNIALGHFALSNNEIGRYNVAIGSQAGKGIEGSYNGNDSPDYSVYLGYLARAKSGNETNEIVIGSNAIGNGTNTVTLGADSITNTYLKGDVHLNGDLYDKNGDLFMGSGSGGVRLGESYSGAIPENQTRTNTCSGPTGTLTIPTSQLYQVTADVFSYRYTGDYNNLAISLLNSDAESVFLKRASILHGSGGYMFIDGSELVYLDAGTYTIAVTGTNANTCGTSSINKIFYGRITATKVIGGGTGKFINGDDTNDAVYTAGNVGIGTTSPSRKLDVIGDIQNTGWIRTKGNSGLYFQDYGGGWNMTDSSWIRSYGGKDVYVNRMLRADDGFQVDGRRMISAAGDVHTAQRTANDHYGYFEGRRNDGKRGFYLGYGNGSSIVNLKLDNASRLDITGGDVYMSGNVGIGTTSPSNALHIKNNTGITLEPAGNNHRWIFNVYDNGTDLEFSHTGGGNGHKITFTQYANVKADKFTTNSDRKLKKDILKLDNYKDILKINAVRFNWKDTGKGDVGVIAQNVQKYFPEFVVKGQDGILSVDYSKLTVPMLNLLQEQDKDIQEQKERLDKQEKEIQELREMIEELKR